MLQRQRFKLLLRTMQLCLTRLCACRYRWVLFVLLKQHFDCNHPVCAFLFEVFERDMVELLDAMLLSLMERLEEAVWLVQPFLARIDALVSGVERRVLRSFPPEESPPPDAVLEVSCCLVLYEPALPVGHDRTAASLARASAFM